MPAAARAGEGAPVGEQVDRRQAQGSLLAAADIDERSVQGEQANIGVQIDVLWHSRENEIERRSQILKDVGVGRAPIVVGAETRPIILLGERQVEHRHMRAHRAGNPYPKMTQPAEAEDSDALAGPRLPVPQRRVDGDAGAEHWGGVFQWNAFGMRTAYRSSATIFSL